MAAAVLDRRHAEALAESFVELAQACETAFRGDVEHLAGSRFQLPGGVVEPPLVEEPPRCDAEVFAHGSRHVFGAAARPFGQARAARREIALAEDSVTGHGEPAGKVVRRGKPSRGSEKVEEVEEEAVELSQSPGAVNQLGGRRRELVALRRPQADRRGKGAGFPEEEIVLPEVAAPETRHSRPRNDQVRLAERCARERPETVAVVAAHENEVAGTEEDFGSIDFVDTRSFLDEEQLGEVMAVAGERLLVPENATVDLKGILGPAADLRPFEDFHAYQKTGRECQGKGRFSGCEDRRIAIK